jgi:hypothetical protein
LPTLQSQPTKIFNPKTLTITPLSTLLVAYEVIIPTLCPHPKNFLFHLIEAPQGIEKARSEGRMIEVKLSPWNVL